MKLLWLKTELLHPVDKGGKIRTYELLKQLRRDHFVTYLTLCDPNDPRESFERAAEYCQRLIPVTHDPPRKFSVGFYCDLGRNLGSSLPYAVGRYRSGAMRDALERELGSEDYDLVVCDFLAPSVNLPEPIGVPAVLFQHNVESVIWERHYRNEAHQLKKAYLFSQWRKMLRFERAACQRFDSVVAVSAADQETLRTGFGVDRVFDIPTGVDTDYFRPHEGRKNAHELVFTGSMDWMPNEDAIVHFSRAILPRIATHIPDVTLTVVGRNPTARLTRLAEADRRITVTGRVDDVRPYMGRAAAYVVPIRVGGGTRLKIYEAMAMGKPVISTTIGAEGLPLHNGEEALIADDPQTFSQSVIAVLQDSQFATRLGQRARQVVCERFGWSQVAAAFVGICERVRKGAPAASAA